MGYHYTNESMKPTTVPNMIGFIDPNLETNRPDAGPKIRNTRANGELYIAALIGYSSKSNWSGIFRLV